MRTITTSRLDLILAYHKLYKDYLELNTLTDDSDDITIGDLISFVNDHLDDQRKEKYITRIDSPVDWTYSKPIPVKWHYWIPIWGMIYLLRIVSSYAGGTLRDATAIGYITLHSTSVGIIFIAFLEYIHWFDY